MDFFRNLSKKFDMNGEIENKDKSLPLDKAIRDIEELFFYEKEGELYEFLLCAVEKPLIENVLYKTEGNQLRAAKVLGINRNTLHMKIKKLNIDVNRFKS